MARKKQPKQEREKPRICDPFMCERCESLGNGYFLCTYDPKQPNGVLVVKNWDATSHHLWCKRRSRDNGRNYGR